MRLQSASLGFDIIVTVKAGRRSPGDASVVELYTSEIRSLDYMVCRVFHCCALVFVGRMDGTTGAKS